MFDAVQTASIPGGNLLLMREMQAVAAAADARSRARPRSSGLRCFPCECGPEPPGLAERRALIMARTGGGGMDD
jgi:hypothetical protein